jgi:hypothetical protein
MASWASNASGGHRSGWLCSTHGAAQQAATSDEQLQREERLRLLL